MGHQVILQLNGGDPFSAGLDDVLGPVGKSEVSGGGDHSNVPGTEPAVVELGRILIQVVRPGDPGAADLHLAHRAAVGRQDGVAVAGDPGLEPAEQPALGDPVPPALLERGAVRGVRDGGERGGLGHPPRLDDLHSQVVEAAHEGLGHRGTTAGHDAQRREVTAVGAHVPEQVVPDGGYGSGEGDALVLDDPGDGLGLQEAARHDQ